MRLTHTLPFFSQSWMFLEVVLVIASMVLVPKIPWKWTKNIPGSLIGIFLATAAEWGIVRQVGEFRSGERGVASCVPAGYPRSNG